MLYIDERSMGKPVSSARHESGGCRFCRRELLMSRVLLTGSTESLGLMAARHCAALTGVTL
jgi:hypothetical protein